MDSIGGGVDEQRTEGNRALNIHESTLKVMMLNNPSQDAFPPVNVSAMHSPNTGPQKKKDAFRFAKGTASHVQVHSNFNSSPSEFTERYRQNSNDRTKESTQRTPYAGVPFRHVPSIDYKNMKMISIRHYNEILNSPERDRKLQDVSNAYLSPQQRMADFMRRDSQQRLALGYHRKSKSNYQSALEQHAGTTFDRHGSDDNATAANENASTSFAPNPNNTSSAMQTRSGLSMISNFSKAKTKLSLL